ncbi:sulfotransferase [Gracilibacillus dipsosauri]|uniref:sulfotransferase n=1 Tax=Gracilibacillus dipsosauri TaxID=178340 RepID=UPI002409419C
MIQQITQKIKREYKERFIYPRHVQGKQKIFCIGRNKTGTTSLRKALEDLGFIVGNQRKAELLLEDYIAGNFSPIFNYCKSAQAFQDVPFSYNLYEHLDKAFPNSLFVLTVRDTPEQWYNSLVNYHSKLFGEGSIPTQQKLKNAQYVYRGWMWKSNRAIYQTPPSDPYNKEILIQHYIQYNDDVINYFANRNNLLVLNVAEKGSYQKLCNFLDVKPLYECFPWENRT